MFLYSWCFLQQLAQIENNKLVQKIYHYAGITLIVILPASFFALVPAYIILLSFSTHYDEIFEVKKGASYKKVAYKIYEAIGYLSLFTNLISCTILTLVIMFLLKVTHNSKINTTTKVNRNVATSHILITLVFTISQIIILFSKSNIQAFRM